MSQPLKTIAALLLIASCGGNYDDTKDCKDHVPAQSQVTPGSCRYGAKLVVEDSVAVCRCPIPAEKSIGKPGR